MAQNSAKILEFYRKHEGLAEAPGGRANPTIMSWIHQYDRSVDDDGDIAWCAIARDQAALATGTARPDAKRTAARSWLKVGTPVELAHAVPGDTVVFWRESPSSWKGHVAVFVRTQGTNVIVLGGNQRNKVCEAAYPISQILGIRRV